MKVYYSSDYNLGQRLIHKLRGDGGFGFKEKTIIAQNVRTNRVSVSGIFATFVAEYLNKHGYGDFGGHYGYVGGKSNDRIPHKVIIEMCHAFWRGE